MEDTYVIKFGGNAIRRPEDTDRLCRDIAKLSGQGARTVLVHGGGPQISEEMQRRGMVPVKLDGFRVTDRAVLDVSEQVLSELNGQVVSGMRRAGAMALGMPGHYCTVCRRKDPFVPEGSGRTVDLGLVGEVAWLDASRLDDLLDVSVVPVVYPIGRDAEGRVLNVNADIMAAGIAAGIGCREMVTVTDVPGILADPEDSSSKLDWVTLGEIDRMISEGRITGGMLPKVEACRKALLAGVPVVRMVDGTDPDCIVSDVMTNGSRGTLITG